MRGRMNGNGVRWRPAGFIIVAALWLGACAAHRSDIAEINVYPSTYKSDILGGVHAYLNDPTGVRDASIAEPALKTVVNEPRYVVCLRFNAKQNGNTYAGVKDFAAVFLAGHFDRFAEKPQELCAGATYQPFPELEKLPR